MKNYDFTSLLSPLDFELLTKDLMEVERGISLENFREGRDKGIDLRYAPQKGKKLIVQCKRYSSFSKLKYDLANIELPKIKKLKPSEYLLVTSLPLSPTQSDELKQILSPYIMSTGDIYGKDRLNSLLSKHDDVERRHIKLWIGSAGVLETLINAKTHLVSKEEIERTIAATKIYVYNPSFDEALSILKKHGVCIISGQPGIGKTTLARMLLLYFYRINFEIIKIESDISEARNVGYQKKPRFYYYDDFLGQTGHTDKLSKNEDQKLLDFMRSVNDAKESCFVLTTREYILNQAKLQYEKLDREKFDHRICVIDLSKYSRRIRAQILYNHLYFSGLPESYLKRLIANRAYIKIVDHGNYNPRLIEYLTTPAWVGDMPADKYYEFFLQNLDNPVQIWGHAFDVHLSEKAKNLLYVLTTLPIEISLQSAESAFEKFHYKQCEDHRQPSSATDFNFALKELDGTFVSTRKIQSTILLRFQNPSIRDFMQNLILQSRLLSKIIQSLVFFEQAEWFWEVLRSTRANLPIEKLKTQAKAIVCSMKDLYANKTCLQVVEGSTDAQKTELLPVAIPARLSKIILAFEKVGMLHDNEWLKENILNLTKALNAGGESMGASIELARNLKVCGILEQDEGKAFLSAIKNNAVNFLEDLDGYDLLALAVRKLPDIFTEREMEEFQVGYESLMEGYVDEQHSENPEYLREEAKKMRIIDRALGADTDAIQTELSEKADKIESEYEPDWDYEGNNPANVPGDSFTDDDMNSMFGTLEK